MKCKVFKGDWYDVQDAFNKWAKGKQLNREVLIHSYTYYNYVKSMLEQLMIVVIYPEGKEWDATSELIYTKARETTQTEEQQTKEANPA